MRQRDGETARQERQERDTERQRDRGTERQTLTVSAVAVTADAGLCESYLQEKNATLRIYHYAFIIITQTTNFV